MESYKRMFKEAERLKPGESMWKDIAAAVRPPVPRAAPAARPAPAPRPALAWRLAASLAMGLGVMAALAVLFREPPRTASGEGPEGSVAEQMATATPEDGSAAEGLQEWHADLGVPAAERFEDGAAESWMDDQLLLDPLLED